MGSTNSLTSRQRTSLHKFRRKIEAMERQDHHDQKRKPRVCEFPTSEVERAGTSKVRERDAQHPYCFHREVDCIADTTSRRCQPLKLWVHRVDMAIWWSVEVLKRVKMHQFGTWT